MIHLLHAPLDPGAFAQWAAGRDRGRRGFDAGLALHRLLSAMFGKGVLQPFRLFAPREGGWSLYAYTEEELQALLDLARTVAPPEMLAVLPLEKLRAKPMPAAFAPGQRLGFDLRARPVRRGAHEMDAFQWEAEKVFASDPEGMAKAGRTREAVYTEWLTERLAGACRLESCRLAAFQRGVSLRGGRELEGPDATLQGCLVVEDGERFGALLAGGVGRHRAYGFGMLMLRPPGRPVPPR